jgi:protein-S-isoprenylcysteine O-methyltransferase Ste14
VDVRAYAVHAAAVTVAARYRLGPLPIRSRAVDAVAATAGAAGITLMAAGMGSFGSARQVSGVSHPHLATSGVYAATRNPQYVGGITALAGLADLRRSLAVAGLTAGYAAAIRAWVPVEEATLEREFGDAYRDYRRRVSRWLGVPRQAGQ